MQTVARNPFLKTGGFFEVGDVYQPGKQTVLGICLFGLKDYREAENLLTEKFGFVVKLQPITTDLCQSYGVKQAKVVFGQVELAKLRPTPASWDWRLSLNQTLPKFRPISKFPPLIRDITISAEPASLGAVLKRLADFQDRYKKEVLIGELIDCYVPKDDHKNRYTLRLIFQNHHRSFTSADIAMIEQRIDEHFAKAA